MERAAGIVLPLKFAQDTPPSVAEIQVYITACIDFLTSPLVSSILECHPNDVAINGPSPEWEPWWSWAGAGDATWKRLVPGWYHDTSPDTTPNIPGVLTQMLATVDELTLPRTLNVHLHPPSPASGTTPLRGMSPKKSHEVLQMSALISSVLTQCRSGIKHIVDVGAGQGYLSRVLSSGPLGMDVLALDFSEVQTKGAERRASNIEKKKLKAAMKSGAKGTAPESTAPPETCSPVYTCHLPTVSAGSLTHEMIRITPQTLGTSVLRWINDKPTSKHPTPVMFIALHACGTLTPDILRCFLEHRQDTLSLSSSGHSHPWYAAGLVVVGCCYNLMSPSSDFPLSGLVSAEIRTRECQLHLSYNHRSLAAQSPPQWSLNTSTKAAAQLAVRKVVYRALFGKLASAPAETADSPHGADERFVKIGRLRDSAYSSLQQFVLEATKKTGAEISTPVDERGHLELISSLEVLHTLRSRIGPVVESLILVDRYLYLVENTPNSETFVLNLFDQELGSGRNLALVVLPQISHQKCK